MTDIRIATVVAALFYAICLPSSANALLTKGSSEKLLLRALEDNYSAVGSRTARPVAEVSTPVRVRFDLGLIKLELDEKEKLLTLCTWTRYRWIDEYLAWNSSEFGNVSKVRLDPHTIWMPDIQLYNTGDVRSQHRQTQCVVMSSGLVIYYTVVIYTVSCALHLTNYPFDEQHCSLYFGSWNHDSSEFDIITAKDGIDLSTFQEDYKETAAWDIVNSTFEKTYAPSANATVKYGVLNFHLTLRRKVVFSTYLLTLPCVFLACLTLAVFWLPPNRPDRTTLAMSTFGSFMLQLLILVEAAPPTTASVPVLGVYYCFNIVIIVVAVILSTVSVNISEGLPCDLPPCLVRILSGRLGKILLIRDAPKPMKQERSGGNKNNETNSLLHKNGTHKMADNCLASSASPTFFTLRDTSHQSGETIDVHDWTALRTEITSLRTLLADIARLLPATVRSGPLLRPNSRIEHRVKCWKAFGLFLDRMFFLLYLVMICVSLIVLFPRPL